jgi:hypothetical protein
MRLQKDVDIMCMPLSLGFGALSFTHVRRSVYLAFKKKDQVRFRNLPLIPFWICLL